MSPMPTEQREHSPPRSPCQLEQPEDPPGTIFIDETRAVIAAQEQGVVHQDRQVDCDQTPSNDPAGLSPSATYFFNNPPSLIGLPLATMVHHVGSPSLNYNAEFQDLASPLAWGLVDDTTDSRPTTSNVDATFPILQSMPEPHPPLGGTLYLGDMVPQLNPTISHPREAYLLKYFTQTWGPIFDCLDADLTFTKSLLRIALSSFSPLFWAILATSALQLSRVSNYPIFAAKYYRSQCSKAIMPILLQSAEPEANEGALLATYVLLRNYEQMTETLMEKNTDTLFTAALAISANPSESLSDKTNLGRAAFWVHFRQDLHVSLLLQVPINTDYPPCLQRDKALKELDLVTSRTVQARQEAVDCAWANSIAVVLFDIINYCFQHGPREIEDWLTLRRRLDHWKIAKPRHFQPYYERGPDPLEKRYFPDIWISSDCQVLAWLYYHTATILLQTHPPNPGSTTPGTERGGPPILDCLESREEVLIHARAICGIAATNPNAQALIVLCHMVTISAIHFVDESEQKETINLIRMAHRVTGHPVSDVEKKLAKGWDSQRTTTRPLHVK